MVLVGAECHTIMTPPNKIGITKKKSEYVLPEPSEARVNGLGQGVFSPNWEQTFNHKDNSKFIEALNEAVKELPVRLS
jgi:hypothetical protein